MKRFTLLIVALAVFTAAPLYAQDKNPVVVMETTMGTIKIELDAQKAPVSVKNFLGYVDAKHYDGTIFHRVIEDFMIQGGGFTKDMKEKETKKPIENESLNGLSNQRGTIAMARTQAPHSATAQFYINVKDNTPLDGDRKAERFGYAVFGKVIDGMDVVDKIKAVRTGTQRVPVELPDGRTIQAPFQDVPVDPVVIKSVRRLKEK